MLYLLGLFFSAQLVAGQVFWKYAVEKGGFELTPEFLLSTKVFGFIFSPWLLAGLAFYATGTLTNMWLLTKFDFNALQGVAIPITLVLTFLAGAILFKDEVTWINMVGLGIIIFGVFLVTYK